MSNVFSTIRERLNQIDLIRNGAVSPLAGGENAAPIGSQYLGPHAIQWTKTGSGDHWAQHLLRAPYFNVKDYGATGVSSSNSRPGIQAAINAAIAGGKGGVIFFPPGDYRCDLTGGGAGGIPTFLLTGAAQGNLLFLGCGRSSRVYMFSTTLGGDRRLFDIREGANYIAFQNIRLDAEITNTTEQQHLIHWQCLTSGQTGHGLVQDVYLGYTRGDGIRMLGEGVNRVSDIKMIRVCAQMVNLTARTFASYQRSTDDTVIDACYNQDVSAIDFEPTSTGDLNYHRITRNILTGIITLTGTTADQSSKRSVFAENIVNDGSVSGLNMQNWVIGDSILLFDLPNITNYNLAIVRAGAMLLFVDNLIIRGPNTTNSDAGFISAEQGGVGDINSVIISGNLGIQLVSNVESTGILIRDLSRFVCSHNMLLPSISTLNSSNFIIVEGPNDVLEEATICGNLGLGLDQRMAGGIAGGGGWLAVNDNFFRQVTNGILLSLPNGSVNMVARNMLVSQTSAVSVIGAGVGMAVEGQADSGVAIYQCDNTPQANVAAKLGSQALRTVGGGAGTTWYLKEADDGLNTGWVGK